MDKQQLETTVTKVLDEMRERPIPLGISNRHIHLCAEDYDRLFPNHPISEKKELLQPGQYAADQTVTLVGPKGQLKNVRLLGHCVAPVRSKFLVPTLVRWELLLHYGCQAVSRARQAFALSVHLLNWT